MNAEAAFPRSLVQCAVACLDLRHCHILSDGVLSIVRLLVRRWTVWLRGKGIGLFLNKALITAYLLSLLVAGCSKPDVASQFYSPPADPGKSLPADGIYPQGRKLAFMGYSGEPARDLTNGFTVAGPVYGDQTAYLRRCESNQWPVVAHVGLRGSFTSKESGLHQVGESDIRREIQGQLQALKRMQSVVWWAITPEELRPWRNDELHYLKVVSEVLRENDPRERPVYLYNPNHRTADTLAPLAPYLDAVGKGCYVNSVGRKRDRAWVRWSVEQEIAAIRAAGRPHAFPLLNSELCNDPLPAEDREIRGWVRHDVYLGLASGARGVVIWSLFKRTTVRRTWQLWYDAYAECGRELNGPRALAEVFLFGERRSDLKVRLVEGAGGMPIKLGGEAEPETTSAEERAPAELNVPSWTATEFAYGHSRWLFLINSGNSPAVFSMDGWPLRTRAENAFDGENFLLDRSGTQTVNLSAYGVLGLRFSASE